MVIRSVTITERWRAGRRFSWLHLHFSVFIGVREDREITQKSQEMQMKHRLCQEKKSERLSATAVANMAGQVLLCQDRGQGCFFCTFELIIRWILF